MIAGYAFTSSFTNINKANGFVEMHGVVKFWHINDMSYACTFYAIRVVKDDSTVSLSRSFFFQDKWYGIRRWRVGLMYIFKKVLATALFLEVDRHSKYERKLLNAKGQKENFLSFFCCTACKISWPPRWHLVELYKTL